MRAEMADSVLVIGADERPSTRLLVELVAEGVRAAGFEAVVRSVEGCPQDLSQFRLVFLGYQAPFLWHQPLSQLLSSGGASLQGREVAIFHSYSARYGRYYFRRLLKKLAKLGIRPGFTLSLRRRGFWALLGGGSFAEEDLARARAFGERTTNTAFGIRVRKHSEKSRIRGYARP